MDIIKLIIAAMLTIILAGWVEYTTYDPIEGRDNRRANYVSICLSNKTLPYEDCVANSKQKFK